MFKKKPVIFVWFVAKSNWIVFVCPLAKTSAVSSVDKTEKSDCDKFIAGTLTSLSNRVALRSM
jgi:hypothetical protein